MVSFTLNNKSVSVDADPGTPLLWVIREQIGLTGTKYGCGSGQCGACTVHLRGRAVRSCRLPVARAAGKKIVTLEGLARGPKLHPLQEAFIQEQAAQCGYCINGMIMQAAWLLATNKRPSESEIRGALADNLCRCGTHLRIIRAVKRASEMMA